MIETIFNENIDLDINLNWTLKDLKEEIYKKTKITFQL